MVCLGDLPSDPPLRVGAQISQSVMDGNVYLRPRVGGEVALLPTEAVQLAAWLLSEAIEASEWSERESKKADDNGRPE